MLLVDVVISKRLYIQKNYEHLLSGRTRWSKMLVEVQVGERPIRCALLPCVLCEMSRGVASFYRWRGGMEATLHASMHWGDGARFAAIFAGIAACTASAWLLDTVIWRRGRATPGGGRPTVDRLQSPPPSHDGILAGLGAGSHGVFGLVASGTCPLLLLLLGLNCVGVVLLAHFDIFSCLVTCKQIFQQNLWKWLVESPISSFVDCFW
jgi:hypothetical protein